MLISGKPIFHIFSIITLFSMILFSSCEVEDYYVYGINDIEITPVNSEKDKAKTEGNCLSADRLRFLAALPRATLFAPLDIGPFLLLRTPHNVVATNHHRNEHAMAKVLRAFRSTEGEARKIIASTSADYVAYCPQRAEVGI